MAKLSIVISAFNEQKKIRACLESAKFADEIIFVDNSSTDKTAKIAGEYTKKVYIQKNDPAKIDLQKNFGISKATGDWILVLDADEIISPELAKEIQTICLSEEKQVNGYWVPRKNIIFGKSMEHSGWYPDYHLRFFKKGKGKYDKEHYHEPITVTGETKKLTEHLVHYNFENVGQFLYKHLQVYAPNEAEELLRRGYVFSYNDAIRIPLEEFLSRYFARGGYKDGFHGLMLSILMAVYHFVIFAYLWEKKKFIDEEQRSIKELDNELTQAGKKINYWFAKQKIDEEKVMLKKFGLKIKRKLRI
jgi:glycosyltransferase involved in cell wall biosynthesis